MMRIAALALIFGEAFSGPAAAKDPTDADWMIRMMVCTQQNSSNMEIYLPQSIVFGKKPLAEVLVRRGCVSGPLTASTRCTERGASRASPNT